MLFSIHCLDGADRAALRAAHLEAHWAYLKSCGVKLVVAGPLFAEDGETAAGSLFVIEAPDRAAAEAFHRGDPFAAAGVWDHVSINGFLKRWDDRAAEAST